MKFEIRSLDGSSDSSMICRKASESFEVRRKTLNHPHAELHFIISLNFDPDADEHFSEFCPSLATFSVNNHDNKLFSSNNRAQ